jgi:hypothetical protein
MPTYVDSEGNRYWLDGEPVPGVHRDDLVFEPEQPPLEPEQPPPEEV